MSLPGWGAVVCVTVAALLGWAPRRHPGLARLARPRRDRHRWARVPTPAGRPAREAARRRTAIIGLADALSMELRAGADPRTALAASARASPLLIEVAAAARSPSGDVAGALRGIARRAGGEAAADLAVLWSVCEASGAALAEPTQRLAAGLRDDEQVRREVAAQLAGPRATAWLLAGLPLFGLLMGAALGAAPWRQLAGPSGPLLVLPGVGLEVVGLLWTRSLTRRALRG